MIATLAARALGYGLALALVGGLLWAGLGALASSGEIGPGDPVPTLSIPTFGPAPTYKPEPRITDDPRATLPPDVLDCGDMDPQDPNVDPEWDCVP